VGPFEITNGPKALGLWSILIAVLPRRAMIVRANGQQCGDGSEYQSPIYIALTLESHVFSHVRYEQRPFVERPEAVRMAGSLAASDAINYFPKNCHCLAIAMRAAPNASMLAMVANTMVQLFPENCRMLPMSTP